MENVNPKYRILIEEGINLDDTVKVLLPVFDSLNHMQEEPLNYCLDVQGLGFNKSIEMKPGDRITIAYDKDDQRLNNTLRKYDLISPKHIQIDISYIVLKDFGFVLPDNEARELVLPFPFDVTVPMHPSHSVFSTAATFLEYYASSHETYTAFVTVRSPIHDKRGPVNPTHPVRALRHFHPTFVSMVSFRVASLVERATLRKKPFVLPSRRNELETVKFLKDFLQGMLDDLNRSAKTLGQPHIYKNIMAQTYRAEQAQILQEVLYDMKEASQDDLM